MRKATSILLAISFVTLFVTVIFMSGPKHPEGLHRGGPQVASVNRNIDSDAGQLPPGRIEHHFFPKQLHEIAGYAVIALGIVHLFYNGKSLLSYIGINRRHQ